MPEHPADLRWMNLALSLGRRGLGQTWPNPSVGCVIVKDGHVVGRGWTQMGGRPHAEAMALAQAGDRAKQATAYVTLEPCAHTGQTPPCASALIAAGIARVVSAMTDPDRRVAGKGHAMLRTAGVAITEAVLADQAATDHMGFCLRTVENRPMVSLKLASSFDGRIATESGESRWITGAHSRRHVHHMRSKHDAVMVGAGTVRADDPSLLVRDMGTKQQPVRVFCDSRLTTAPTCQLGRTARDVPVWIAHGDTAPAKAVDGWLGTGARLLKCKTQADGRLDMTDVLRQLAGLGLTRVFCEGGGQLAASLLQDGLVDRLIGFTAGLALGHAGLPSVAALPNMALADFGRFQLAEARRSGGDVLHIWRRI